MRVSFKRIKRAACNRFLDLQDEYYDRRICGQSLVRYVPSVFRDDKNGIGMTGSQSTHYAILKIIFSHVMIKPTDMFLDVGCGKGRVLAFLLKEKCPCQLRGIEINEISGRVAAEWIKRYDQARVFVGDAFDLDYNDYTVLFLGRPFLPKTFLQFIEQLEMQVKHPITFIYWVDQQSGHMLSDRKGWTLIHREVLKTVHGLGIFDGYPQGYSVWKYEPVSK